MWRKSRFKIIENKKNDLLWLLLHRVVRVRYSLKNWGYIDFDKCASCSRVETAKRCFIECPRVVWVWDFLTPFLSRLLGSPFSLSFSSVLFPLCVSVLTPITFVPLSSCVDPLLYLASS